MTKDKILFILQKNRGNYLSGEEIAGELGISRNAVWKSVNALKSSGYKIRAVKNRGYTLTEEPAALLKEAIEAHLPERHRDCALSLHKTADSTNMLARRMALEGAPHKTLFLAEGQTAGRGRRGKSFFSPEGSGLYMSLLLRPEAILQKPQLITIAAAISVCRAIEAQLQVCPKIKWVNDILLNGKKVCGILTEAVTDFESGGIECIIVGVGVNCALPSDGFPDGIKDIAGALPEGVSRNRLCGDIAAGILDWFQNLHNPLLIEEYRSRCDTVGKRVSFIYNGESAHASALGIDGDGGLIAEFDDGTITVLNGGEISVEAAL